MIRKLLRSPIASVVLFAAAAAFILYGGINGAQAAPRIVSEYYGAQVKLTNIETALVENGNVVEGDGALLHNLVPEGEKFQVGKTYDEVLSVRNVGVGNDGGIDQYVRVTVYKYWLDKAGKQIKDTKLKPEYIKLNFVTGNGWTIDEQASTEERTVLYYAEPISKDGGETTPFADKLTISGETITAISANDTGDTYDYEDVTFEIKAVVDAVQTHNGPEAMRGAWGRTNTGY